MATAQEYLEQINQIANEVNGTIDMQTVDEAKLHKRKLAQAQTNLRQIKSHINEKMKQIRQDYAERSAQSGHFSDAGKTIFSLFLSRGARRSNQADIRRQLKKNQEDTLAPYESIKRRINAMISEIDSYILQIDEIIVKMNNAASPEEEQEVSRADLSDIELLKELKELHNAGVLTDDEFEAKKADILNRM